MTPEELREFIVAEVVRLKPDEAGHAQLIADAILGTGLINTPHDVEIFLGGYRDRVAHHQANSSEEG